MVDDLGYMQELLEQCESRSASVRRWDRAWRYKQKTLVFDFHVYGHQCGVDVAIDPEGMLDVTVLGRTEDAKRILRNALIGKFPMVKRQGERHLLGRLEAEEPLHALRSIECLLDEVLTRSHKSIDSMKRNSAVPEGCVNVFWWDKRPNFGDAVGPWLFAKITGKQPVNGRGRMLRDAPVASVGSIINIIDQDGTRIWGTGLMGPLSRDAVKRMSAMPRVSVLAVRGKRTRAELISSLGWDVPETYGDPALLLPRFLPPQGRQITSNRIAVVPHYLHSKYFSEATNNDTYVVDVEQGMEQVVQEIAAARACISTSLHGVIIAQAYGVPWTWLRIADQKLGGDKFKFEDFFSTLDESAVQSVSISSSDIATLDFQELARDAALPDLQISLDALMDSFPTELKGERNKPDSRSTRVLDAPATPSYGGDDGADNLRETLNFVLGELDSQRHLLELLSARGGLLASPGGASTDTPEASTDAA